MTFNDWNSVMALILRYLTEFMYNVVVKQLYRFLKINFDSL